MSSTTLDARHISKSFGATRALEDACLTVEPGEVHGLLGENGSGKSTLIRILAGYHAPHPGGELAVAGRLVELPLTPARARSLGLAFVHQDLGLITSLSVAENVRAGELATRRWAHISWKRERREARRALSRLDLNVDPRATVHDLRTAERALLAIARAVHELRLNANGQRLLVLDEPTTWLPGRHTERLLGFLRSLAAGGAGVLLVSHDLDQVLESTDRITVLRDGRTVGSFRTAAVAKEELAAAIVGRPVGRARKRPLRSAPGPVVASIARLSSTTVWDVALDVRAGEVLGLTGLSGSGFEDVLSLIFGGRRCKSGLLTLGHVSYDLTAMTPEGAVRAGVALVPGSRRDGAVESLSVADNVTLPILDRYAGRLVLDRGALRAAAGRLLSEFDVRPHEPDLPFRALSGGNQRKALLAKWLQTAPRLLLLDEPTQGVDVGARERILTLIREAAEGGVAVVCASSDDRELAALCDRVLVFSGGRIVRELR